MKVFFIALVATVAATALACTSQKKLLGAGCYKGRLEIKGICSNYTIKLLDGTMDTTNLAASWTDETTGKGYTNVFALGSPCTFPETINAGDEFYFTIDTTTVQNCAVCMAYYPHPQKAVKIKVLNAPCN
jgi:hypothetical protein